MNSRDLDARAVTFTGREESGVLHAAGSWMAGHLDATILFLDWMSDAIACVCGGPTLIFRISESIGEGR